MNGILKMEPLVRFELMPIHYENWINSTTYNDSL